MASRQPAGFGPHHDNLRLNNFAPRVSTAIGTYLGQCQGGTSRNRVIKRRRLMPCPCISSLDRNTERPSRTTKTNFASGSTRATNSARRQLLGVFSQNCPPQRLGHGAEMPRGWHRRLEAWHDPQGWHHHRAWDRLASTPAGVLTNTPFPDRPRRVSPTKKSLNDGCQARRWEADGTSRFRHYRTPEPQGVS